jgi:hypothetical protein
MRRYLVFLAVALIGPLWESAPARAQFYQQRSQAAPATPPTVNYFGLPSPRLLEGPIGQISPRPAQTAPAQAHGVASRPLQNSRYYWYAPSRSRRR